MAKRTVDFTSVPQDPNLSISDIQAGLHKAAIKAESDILEIVPDMGQAELDAFMEEELVIAMAPFPPDSNMVGVPVTVVPHFQYIIGGAVQKVKRKYVEVLARARTTTYKQYSDPLNPANSRPVPSTSPSYTFSVVEDPNPRGYAWLKAIQNTPG